MAYSVGQHFVMVTKSDRSGVPDRFHDVVVTKVGRSWLTLDNDQRASIETLVVDHGHYSSNQKLYLSREQYDNERALNAAWWAFYRAVDRQYRTPTTNIEAINQAAALLNLELEPKP